MSLLPAKAKTAVAGFTLIEILVAVLIFALLSTAAYAALDILLRTQKAIQQRSFALQQLQTAVGRFERDIRQAITRGVHDEYGEPVPALRGTGAAIEISRGGLSNPLDEARASIERVGWSLNADSLTRVQHRTLDRASNSKPITTPIAENITRLQFRYLDGEQWRTQWPKPNSEAAQRDQLPRAVELIVDSSTFGEIRRIVECAQNPLAESNFSALAPSALPP